MLLVYARKKPCGAPAGGCPRELLHADSLVRSLLAKMTKRFRTTHKAFYAGERGLTPSVRRLHVADFIVSVDRVCLGFRGRIHPAQLEAAVQICEANRDGTKRERGKVFRYHLKTGATLGRSMVRGGRFKLSWRKL